MQPTSNDHDHEPGASDRRAVAADLTAAGVPQPAPSAVPVTDPGVLRAQRDFAEAVRQTGPLARPGSRSAAELAKIVSDGSAMRTGLSLDAAERCVTSARPLEGLLKGAEPKGTLAEVVAAADYRELHAGRDPGIVNAPERVATNVADIRLSPHHASRKDLVFAFEDGRGALIWKYNGQVKNGQPQYVTDRLVRMAERPDYGKIAYVDARYVGPNGAPRVAPDAFSAAQARKLEHAGVRLRGISGLPEFLGHLGSGGNEVKCAEGKGSGEGFSLPQRGSRAKPA